MTNAEAAFVGVVLGYAHVVIFALFQNFALASFILYGDQRLIPIAATLVIDVLMLVTVLTYTYWLDPVQNALVRLMEGLTIGDGDDE